MSGWREASNFVNPYLENRIFAQEWPWSMKCIASFLIVRQVITKTLKNDEQRSAFNRFNSLWVNEIFLKKSIAGLNRSFSKCLIVVFNALSANRAVSKFWEYLDKLVHLTTNLNCIYPRIARSILCAGTIARTLLVLFFDTVLQTTVDLYNLYFFKVCGNMHLVTWCIFRCTVPLYIMTICVYGKRRQIWWTLDPLQV